MLAIICELGDRIRGEQRPGESFPADPDPRLAREAGGAYEERITREGQGAVEAAPIRLLSFYFLPQITP